MRALFVTTALAALAACAPPASQATHTSATSTRRAAVCNRVSPDLTKLVLLGERPLALAHAELLGGPLAPGVYDLSGGYVSGGAPSWRVTRAAALEVVETGVGERLNYASMSNNVLERWSATFHEGPPTTIDYTCGHSGRQVVTFQAQAQQLQLRVPDPSGVGEQTLIFTRRR